jgi:anaerobic magnesium-protoporphyrin IX monomethyl ester cyclase
VRILLLESGVMAPERFVYQCYPPTGLLYLASYLRAQRPGHVLRLFDMMGERAGPAAVDAVLKDFAPDLVAIHAMSFQASCMNAVAARVKAWDRRCVVAAGGPHPSAAPDWTLAGGDIDVAGIGEGEDTFVEIVDRIGAGQDLAGTAGTAVTREGELVLGPARPYLDDLDRVPFPAWDLIDLSRYFTDVMLNQNDITCRREVTTIFTSRACPFGCIYCHNMFGKKLRVRSVTNVLDEIETLAREHGVRELHVIDDCFNCKVERADEVFTGVLDRGLDLKFAFPNGIRGDRLPDGLLDLMKEAGVYKANFGIESGSPRIQKLIRKGLSLEALADGVARAASRGIFTHGFFMMGFPGETADELRQTIDFAGATLLHTAGFALLSPFPGTEVHRMAEAAGRQISFDPDDTSYSRLTVNLTAVSDPELARLHRLAHWKFYGRPRRLLRILTTMPHPSDFVRVGLMHFRLKFL